VPGAATFSLATLLVLVTIFAISLALERAVAPLGILAFFLVAPAYLRTARIVRRLRENDLPVDRWRDYGTFFLRCCGLSVVTGSAVGSAFFATYWPFAAFIDTRSGGAIDFDPFRVLANLVFFLAGLFCGMASGGLVLVLIAVHWWPVREVVEVYLVRHDFGREQD
jgi:hypothetical protein